jgi:predicted ATP-grasp superfamily ATP-dependent carboligase
MKTFLLLYTERPTRKIFSANRPGRLVYASDDVSDEDRQTYDECIQLPAPNRLKETLDILGKLKFDELVAQTEYSLLPGSILARERGLRALSPESAFLCTNKWLQRRELEGHGVPIPNYALVESEKQVIDFAQTFPVVLKPIASTLGRLVVKVNSKEELEQYVRQLHELLPKSIDILRCREFASLTKQEMDCDPFKHFLVEEYIDGEVQETDGLLFGEQLCLFGVTEQILANRSPYFFIEGYVLSQTINAELQEATIGAVRATQLTDAGFSIEMRGGKVIEVNGRLGEDDGFPDLFKEAIGKFPLLKWLDEDSSLPEFSGVYALAYVNWYEGGTLKSLTNEFVRETEDGMMLGFSDQVPITESLASPDSVALGSSASCRHGNESFNEIMGGRDVCAPYENEIAIRSKWRRAGSAGFSPASEPTESLCTALNDQSSQFGHVRFELVAKKGARLNAPPHEEINPHLAFAIAHSDSFDSAVRIAKKSLEGVRFEFE